MTHSIHRRTLVFAIAISVATAFATDATAQSRASGDDLVGAWRGKVAFTSGMFAELKDLEYMYVFHADGTMTESSNYDAVPPVPPAYGVWRKTGPRSFEAKYTFFQSKSVANSQELMKSGGWGPGGYGIIRQSFTLSGDGNSFSSKISVDMFDAAGKPIGGKSPGTASGSRIRF
jgi:hypothetical protein